MYNLYQNCTKGDDDDSIIDALFLMNNEVDRYRNLSTKQKVVKDVYIKFMRPYGWDPRTTRSATSRL